MSKSSLSQQDQLENLKAHYGLSLNFVEVTIPLTFNEMLEIWGENCDEYEHGCALCRAWHQWNTNNHKVTVVVSRDSIIRAAKKMRTFKEQKVRIVDDVHCDACGKSTTNNNNVGPDYGTLESCWGYGSKNDGSKYHIDLCENCFFEVVNFIRDKRQKILGPFNYPYEKDPLDGIEYL